MPLNRPKFDNASHVIIFARLNKMSQDYVDGYFDLLKEVRNQTDEDIKQFYDMVSGKASSMPEDALNGWTSRQGPAKHMMFYEPGGLRLEFFVKPE